MYTLWLIASRSYLIAFPPFAQSLPSSLCPRGFNFITSLQFRVEHNDDFTANHSLYATLLDCGVWEINGLLFVLLRHLWRKFWNQAKALRDPKKVSFMLNYRITINIDQVCVCVCAKSHGIFLRLCTYLFCTVIDYNKHTSRWSILPN